MHRKAHATSVLREAVLLIAIAVGLGLAVNAWHPRGLSLLAGPESGEPGSDPLRISFEDASRRQAEGTAVFVDARSPADYAAGHIPGALSGPEREFDRWIEGFIAANEPDAEIIAYCEGVQCELSRALVEKLQDLGYVNARYVVDGWGRWKAKGLPVER